jgi:hypothetical protein
VASALGRRLPRQHTIAESAFTTTSIGPPRFIGTVQCYKFRLYFNTERKHKIRLLSCALAMPAKLFDGAECAVFTAEVVFKIPPPKKKKKKKCGKLTRLT